MTLALALGTTKAAAGILAAVLLPAARAYPWVLLQVVTLAVVAVRIRPGEATAYRALAACYALGAAWYARTPLSAVEMPAWAWYALEVVPVLLVVALPVLVLRARQMGRHLDAGLRWGVAGVIAAAVLPLAVVLPSVVAEVSALYVAIASAVAYTVPVAAALAVLILQEISRWTFHSPLASPRP